MNVRIAVTYWGDHRGWQQHRSHDHIEQARWRWRVARRLAEQERERVRILVDNDAPAFLRRQAL